MPPAQSWMARSDRADSALLHSAFSRGSWTRIGQLSDRADVGGYTCAYFLFSFLAAVTGAFEPVSFTPRWRQLTSLHLLCSRLNLQYTGTETHTKQQYLPSTNILLTKFLSEEGEFMECSVNLIFPTLVDFSSPRCWSNHRYATTEISTFSDEILIPSPAKPDFMPLVAPKDSSGIDSTYRPWLVRRVEVIRGTLPFIMVSNYLRILDDSFPRLSNASPHRNVPQPSTTLATTTKLQSHLDQSTPLQSYPSSVPHTSISNSTTSLREFTATEATT